MKQLSSVPPAPDLKGAGLKIGIVVARFNWHITGALLREARHTLHHLEVADDDVAVYYAPGSFELPIVAQTLLQSQRYDALICFGCVMKGATRHDVIVGDAAGQGIQHVALTTGIPVIFGVICAENQQQAEERIVRGVECAEAAVEMALMVQGIKQEKEYSLCLQESLKK